MPTPAQADAPPQGSLLAELSPSALGAVAVRKGGRRSSIQLSALSPELLPSDPHHPLAHTRAVAGSLSEHLVAIPLRTEPVSPLTRLRRLSMVGVGVGGEDQAAAAAAAAAGVSSGAERAVSPMKSTFSARQPGAASARAAAPAPAPAPVPARAGPSPLPRRAGTGAAATPAPPAPAPVSVKKGLDSSGYAAIRAKAGTGPGPTPGPAPGPVRGVSGHLEEGLPLDTAEFIAAFHPAISSSKASTSSGPGKRSSTPLSQGQGQGRGASSSRPSTPTSGAPWARAQAQQQSYAVEAPTALRPAVAVRPL